MAMQIKVKKRPDDYVIPQISVEEVDRRELNGGASSWVELLRSGTRVRKAVQPWVSDYYSRTAMIMDIRNEIDIYNHLPKGHPRFLEMLSSYDTGIDVGFDLEYLPIGSLRTYLQENHVEVKDGMPVIPARLRARWAVELADGIGFLHAHDVIHCDIKPHNMLLDNTLGIRIIDMAGSRLGNGESSCCESDRFFMPRDLKTNPGTVTTDLFAVGMSLFEIVTGAQPFGEIANRREIRARYERQEFPSLAVVTAPAETSPDAFKKYVTKYKSANPDEVGLGAVLANTSVEARALAPANASGREILFADVMRQCWHGQYASAADVLAGLAEEVRATFTDDDDVAYIEKESGISLRGGTVGQRLDGYGRD